MSALHFAANAGHLEVVKVLLAAKANIHALDEVLFAISTIVAVEYMLTAVSCPTLCAEWVHAVPLGHRELPPGRRGGAAGCGR
jgi:hypothetical protein